ncbi:MAG: hypothetical protein H6766_01095 [Candidatus Peribacteria bacterium]|nr:MAG: hypothetical protein H6766_01095 [Candidatus Peribacteria bacterium]
MSGITIADTYSPYLTFENIISSYPDLSVAPTTFSHDTALRKLRRDAITLSG